MPEASAWQNRPLDAVYPFVFLDAIHYKVREENHQYVTKAAYMVLRLNTDGKKDILGIWIGQHESAKFWAGVLNDLKNRGVQDILIVSVDGLSGFVDAIGAAFPQTMAFKDTWGKQYPLPASKAGRRIGIFSLLSTHIRWRSGKSYIQPISLRV